MHGIIAPPTRAAFPSTSPPQGMEVFFFEFSLRPSIEHNVKDIAI